MLEAPILSELTRTPFIAHPAIKGGHAQTIAAALIPRRKRIVEAVTESRLFTVSPGIKVLCRCSWHVERISHPTLVVVHGMEGSAESPYMLSTAEKALAAGFNVLRVNVRNCGGTESMTPTLYHAGLTDDLRYIVSELSEQDRLNMIYLMGFSLGGNLVLKLAGEYGDRAPGSLRGVVAVSPSIDLTSSLKRIELRSNLFYHLRFVRSLKLRMRRKARLFPERYDPSMLRRIWSIREFDHFYTAPHSGFTSEDDYYERASSLPYIPNIKLPSLIVHAKDDPMIPYDPLERPEVASNPNVLVIGTENGGHVGFVAYHPVFGDDRFWAEAKAIEFFRLLKS